jgi:hypothetical protein
VAAQPIGSPSLLAHDDPPVVKPARCVTLAWGGSPSKAFYQSRSLFTG